MVSHEYYSFDTETKDNLVLGYSPAFFSVKVNAYVYWLCSNFEVSKTSHIPSSFAVGTKIFISNDICE